VGRERDLRTSIEFPPAHRHVRSMPGSGAANFEQENNHDQNGEVDVLEG